MTLRGSTRWVGDFMTEREVLEKISAASGVPIEHLLTGLLSQREWDKIIEALKTISAYVAIEGDNGAV